MTGRCLHSSGELKEFIETAHCRRIENFVLDSEGINAVGNILGYEFTCDLCGETFRFTSRPRQKWLRAIYYQLAHPRK